MLAVLPYTLALTSIKTAVSEATGSPTHIDKALERLKVKLDHDDDENKEVTALAAWYDWTGEPMQCPSLSTLPPPPSEDCEPATGRQLSSDYCGRLDLNEVECGDFYVITTSTVSLCYPIYKCNSDGLVTKVKCKAKNDGKQLCPAPPSAPPAPPPPAYSYENIGQGACLRCVAPCDNHGAFQRGGVPWDGIQGSQSAAECARACYRAHGTRCKAFDTRGGCMFYMSGEDIIDSNDHANMNCYVMSVV